MAGQFMHGITGGAVRTAIAAIGLGLVGHRAYHTRIGRNHRYDSLGNAATAAGMGAIGYFVSPGAPFFAAAALCLPAYFCLSLINAGEIDYARARGAVGRKEPKAARWHEIARNRPLLIFALCLFLFQFADASMLPLASERLAADYKASSELFTAAFVVVTSAVIGIMTPLIVADVTKGTGRYNFSLGAVSMIAGIGATISFTAMGFLAQRLGFPTAFTGLAVVAGLGLGAVWWLMPETVDAARAEE